MVLYDKKLECFSVMGLFSDFVAVCGQHLVPCTYGVFIVKDDICFGMLKVAFELIVASTTDLA